MIRIASVAGPFFRSYKWIYLKAPAATHDTRRASLLFGRELAREKPAARLPHVWRSASVKELDCALICSSSPTCRPSVRSRSQR